MEILAPDNFRPERKYILNTIFRDFLGIEFELKFEIQKNYILNLPNNKCLEIEDLFFPKAETSLIQKDILPGEIKWYKDEIGSNKFKFPIIYGNDRQITQGEDKIHFSIDFIGSSFFLLTRLEEYLSKKEDEHGRLRLDDMHSWQEMYYEYPVVDIYVEYLRLKLNELCPELNLPSPELNILPSHDLDYYVKWNSIRNLLGAYKRAAKKGKPIRDSLKYLKSYVTGDNPYSIERHIQASTELGVKPIFYFLVGGDTEFDRSKFEENRAEAARFVKLIKEHDFEIGLHCSYDTMTSPNQIQKEKAILEDLVDQEIIYSRQHYLRLSIPQTYTALESAGIKMDASMGFSKYPGFRSGTSRKYRFFNLESREERDFYILPLLLMDTSILNTKNLMIDEAYDLVKQIRSRVEKYGGNWHFLIHNSNYFWQDEKEYFELWQSFYQSN